MGSPTSHLPRVPGCPHEHLADVSRGLAPPVARNDVRDNAPEKLQWGVTTVCRSYSGALTSQ